MSKHQRRIRSGIVLYIAAFAAGMLMAAAQTLMPATVLADPLPPGRECPNPTRDIYVETLGQCTYTGKPSDANIFEPVCDQGYVPIFNTYECAAPPKDIPPPPGSEPPPGPPPAPTCNNPIDRYDESLKMCVHGGPTCYSPYILTPYNQCATDPALSRPGSESGSLKDLPDPKCAVVAYGPIRCPINDPAIPPKSQGCFVLDASAPNPADRVYKKADCNHPAFTPPANGSCAADTPQAIRDGSCDVSKCVENCNLVKKYIDPAVKVLAALVGIGVTLSIVWAGIQYSRSADDPRVVSEAKHRILISLLTLVGFFLFTRFLDWIVPGGIGL